MRRTATHYDQTPLDEVAHDQIALLVFDLMRISAELLDLLGEFDHIDRSWVHNHLYLCPPQPPTHTNRSEP